MRFSAQLRWEIDFGVLLRSCKGRFRRRGHDMLLRFYYGLQLFSSQTPPSIFYLKFVMKKITP
jgi:hypothetical protein